ncbi:MAG: hypothetical protein K8W52_01325 [Deltaproteobacteria bacterium]|nr:hypothetical protein [Deltaproteobacteria bacterium]
MKALAALTLAALGCGHAATWTAVHVRVDHDHAQVAWWRYHRTGGLLPDTDGDDDRVEPVSVTARRLVDVDLRTGRYHDLPPEGRESIEGVHSVAVGGAHYALARVPVRSPTGARRRAFVVVRDDDASHERLELPTPPGVTELASAVAPHGDLVLVGETANGFVLYVYDPREARVRRAVTVGP